MNAKEETQAILTRHQARLKVFSAVYRGAPLLPAFDLYVANDHTIVSPTVRIRAENLGISPGAAVLTEAMTIFFKDVAIAERFNEKEGVDINGKTLHLPGLMRRERIARRAALSRS